MNKINCTEHKCSNNCCNCCKKETVQIGEDTMCDSYSECKEFVADSNNILEEYAAMHNDFITDNNMILCECHNCLSNSSGTCTRKKVNVSREGITPMCIDYHHE